MKQPLISTALYPLKTEPVNITAIKINFKLPKALD